MQACFSSLAVKSVNASAAAAEDSLKGKLYCVKQDITPGSKTLHKTTELQLFCK